MDKEDIEKLFQKFSRAQNAPSAATGIGLGLYLVATIVKAHEGKVWAESPGRGKGATFFLELPVAINGVWSGCQTLPLYEALQ